MRSRWRSVALILLMLAGCAREHDRFAPGFIQVDIESSPTALDPRYATDAISERIVELMFDPMVRLDSHGGFSGDLAERVERTSPTEVIFHLRRGVCFSDGREVTARDVKYTFDFVMNRTNRSPKAAGLQQLASIDTLDDYTIKLTTRGPYAPTLEMAMLGIVPDGTPVPGALDAPLGSGPFKLLDFQRDERVILDRNPAYPMPDAHAVNGIIFKVVPDPTVRALELVEHICDLALNDIQADLLRTCAHSPGFMWSHRPARRTGISRSIFAIPICAISACGARLPTRSIARKSFAHTCGGRRASQPGCLRRRIGRTRAT
jgi:ABC-type transport system substrate-binding protein